jgi:hypothetical protein
MDLLGNRRNPPLCKALKGKRKQVKEKRRTRKERERKRKKMMEGAKR